MARGDMTENDTRVTQVQEAAAKYRASGSVRDLIDLRDARLAAGASITAETHTAWGDPHDAPPPDDLAPPQPGALPEIDADALTIDTLRGAMHHHGALIVRGFFTPRMALDYTRRIDSVLDAVDHMADLQEAGDIRERPAAARAWAEPVIRDKATDSVGGQNILKGSGAIRTLMSPKVMQLVLDDFERRGLRSLLQQYFQDEPCLSFNKSVLRRAEPLGRPADWHQDGAFMGAGIHSLNLWVALTECGEGTESAGMDLIPQRLDKILETGSNGAIFDWSLSGDTVAGHFKATAPARPYFGAGDAVFFDHFNLHATSYSPSFTRTRYAIENWFFAKSHAPLNQRPVFW